MTELLILTSLMYGPRHGYEIKKSIVDREINNNTLYPLLKKLEAKGQVSVSIVQQEGKPAKKVYTITEDGKNRLYELLNDFNETKALNNDEFFYRVAFFQFLDKESIKNILDIRERALYNNITKVNALSLLNNMPDKSYDILFVHRFVGSQRKENFDFINALRKKYNIEDDGVSMQETNQFGE